MHPRHLAPSSAFNCSDEGIGVRGKAVIGSEGQKWDVSEPSSLALNLNQQLQ
jgi:hypothetical protein